MLHDRIHPLLLVEDEPDDQSFVKRALAKAGIINPLVVRSTVADAKTYLESPNESLKPALVIADVYLPNGETGLDFLAWLRRQAPPVNDIPVMMFSVSSTEEHRLEARALRSVIFLQKPAHEAALTNAVQALGFVITSTLAGGEPRRVIGPR